VEDNLAASDGMKSPLVALYVALDDLDVRRKRLQVRAASSREVVEDPDLVPEADQALG
jgi:hypothetical protein